MDFTRGDKSAYSPPVTEGRFAVERGASVETREELLAALAVASELEHLLLAQYLFAGYSLKKRPEEGSSPAQLERVRSWERLVLKVAHDEMLHFATVCKLSAAVGGTPHLNRPDIAAEAARAFPFEMKLERFGAAALKRFIRFETPEDQAAEAFGLAPELPEYEYLGELYGQISGAFEHLGDAAIVGPAALLEEERWDLRRPVAPVRTAAEAIAAIDVITEEGEGSRTPGPNSHYERFIQVSDELVAELGKGEFEPARPVVDNPVTKPEHESTGTLLPDGPVREVAELFNHVYTTVLLLIGQYYAPVDETDTQRSAVAAISRRTMSGIVRPLAEILTELPVDDSGQARAGAPFETYTLVELGVSAPARFAVLDERVRLEAGECERLAGELDHPRLRFLTKNLRLLHAQLGRAATGGGAPAFARV